MTLRFVATGPVSASQARGAVPAGASLHVIACTGDGAPSCGAIAEGFGPADGPRLPGLLSRAGAPLAADDVLVLFAFSAGGSLVKRVLLHPADRAHVAAVVLCDATYTDWAAPGKPAAPEGFVRFGLDSLSGEHFLLATASSSPNKHLPSGSETLAAIRDEIGARRGAPLPLGAVFSVKNTPAWALRSGGLVLADFGSAVSHGGHVALGSELARSLLWPWLAGNTGPGPTGPGAPPPASPASPAAATGVFGAVAAFGLGVGVGYVAARLVLAQA